MCVPGEHEEDKQLEYTSNLGTDIDRERQGHDRESLTKDQCLYVPSSWSVTDVEDGIS